MSKVAKSVAIVGIAVALGPAGFGVLSATTFITASAALNASISLLASTVLAQLTAKRLKPSGIQREATTSGSVEPQSFIVGYSATAGHSAWPESTHGKAGKTPNAFLTYVIDLGDLPAGPLDGLIVDGEYVEIDWTTPIGPNDGHPVLGRLAGFMWVRYHDGTQTTADSFLMAQYGSDPDVPWTADMVLAGVPHMVLVFKFDRERFKGFPAVKAVGASIPLYDPRADSSVGGSGAMRWNDPSTWVPRRNLALQIYNIRRGIPLPDGDFWGGGHSADDLPLDVWIDAINTCDTLVPDIGGVMRPQYHGGFEIRLSDEPADIEAELLKGCSGRIADVGGQIIIQVGAPSLPVLFFSDDDILATADVQDMPLPAPGDIWNGVEATFPQPSALWAARPSPPLFDEVLRAEDGGQRKVATVSLPAVPFPGQVQRLQQSWLKDSRRFRRHILTLGSQAHALEPFDTVGWTSPKHGYVQKLFEVAAIEFSPLSADNRLTLRERDPADFIVPTTLLDEPPVGIINRPVPEQAVPGYDFVAGSVTDASGAPRRPDLRHVWDPTDLEDVTGVLLEVRVASTGAPLPSVTISNVTSGEALVGAGNIIPGVTYEGRATLIAPGRRTVPSAWISAVAPPLVLMSADLGQSSVTASKILTEDQTNLVPDSDLQDAASWGNPSKFTVIPTSTNTTTSKTKGEIQYTGALPVTVPVASNGTKFPVLPGEKLLASYQVGRINGTTHTVRGAVVYFDRAGAVVGASLVGGSLTATATALVDRSAVITVPAGAWSALFQFLVDSTDGNVRFHAPVVRRMNAADLVVDSGITTAKLALRSVSDDVMFTNTEVIGGTGDGLLGINGAVGRSFSVVVPSDGTNLVVSLSTRITVSGSPEQWDVRIKVNGVTIVDRGGTGPQELASFEGIATVNAGTSTVTAELGYNGSFLNGFVLVAKQRAR